MVIVITVGSNMILMTFICGKVILVAGPPCQRDSSINNDNPQP
jgi:hypothetical protein